MNSEQIRELLNKRPFEPFEVHLSNGEVFSVRHPEVAILTKTRLVITDPDPEADQITITSLLHIASIKMLSPA